MLYLKDLEELEVFKRAKFIEFTDEDGDTVSNQKAIRLAPILNWVHLPGDGLKVKLWICNRQPAGFRPLRGVLTAPRGYKWIWNGRSRHSGRFRHALLKV